MTATTDTRHASDCTCREHPLPSTMTVRAARDHYLAENGFTVAAYDEPTTKASFLGIAFGVPNTPRHRWGIMLHDLHHVATGFGTDSAGEGEISAWEARRGVRALGAYVGSIVLSGVLLGVAYAPVRTWQAMRASGSRDSLFDSTRPYEELLAMTVGELRELLAVPRDGLARIPRRLHAFAPGEPRATAA